MRHAVPNQRFWVSLAAFLIAVSVFIPATNTLAQRQQRSFDAGPVSAAVRAGAGPCAEC